MSFIASRTAQSTNQPTSSAGPHHECGTPMLRITVDVPLDCGTLPPSAARLLEFLRELAEQPQATVDQADGQQAEPAGATVLRHPAADVRPRTTPLLRMLPGPRVVLRDDEPIPLTRLEFELLYFLATHPRQVFSRRQLLNAVWRDNIGESRTVDVHVRRLRAKLGPDVPVVSTVHGVGYRLADDAQIILHSGGPNGQPGNIAMAVRVNAAADVDSRSRASASARR